MRVVVETARAELVRVVARRVFRAGKQSVTWNGRLQRGKLAAAGTYVVRVEATNKLGLASLQRPLSVRRLTK